LNLLRRCYKLGMKGNRPKVRAMPLIPRFKDNKRTGTLEFDRHDDLAKAYRTLGDHWHVPLEAVFETAYTLGWRHGEITPLKVRQFRDVSPTEAWLHLEDRHDQEHGGSRRSARVLVRAADRDAARTGEGQAA
jgi:hypothetical protein